ncbi:hypothetical protein TNCV_1913151 [Trichonephila clavipes]|nr:hypothetical protein TNCV_1913151 [Trichonephila clavipes]
MLLLGKKIVAMSRVRRRNAYQPISHFDRESIVAYRDCCLLCTTVLVLALVEILRLSPEFGIHEVRWSLHSNPKNIISRITNNRVDKRVIRMNLWDSAVTSQTLSENGSFQHKYLHE